MTSLLMGEMSLGAVAFRFEPSGAFAKVLAGEGAGVKGVDTEHASVVARTHTALPIVADFSIVFSNVKGHPGRLGGTLANRHRLLRYLHPAPSHVVDPRGIHCHG